MALKAEIKVEGNNYKVLECEYEFSQAIDITGLPSDRPRGGQINVVIVSPPGADLSLYEWMCEKENMKDGHVLFEINDEAKFSTRKIEFKNAHCIRLYEYFNSNNALPMYMKLGILAESLIISDGTGDGYEFKMID